MPALLAMNSWTSIGTASQAAAVISFAGATIRSSAKDTAASYRVGGTTSACFPNNMLQPSLIWSAAGKLWGGMERGTWWTGEGTPLPLREDEARGRPKN